MNDTIDAQADRQALDRYNPPAGHQPAPGYSPATGDMIVAAPVDISMDAATYVGMSERPVSPEQASILNRELPDEDIDIRPDGAIFMSHARLRRRLNEAFRPGGWALRKLTPIQCNEATDKQNKIDLVLSAEYGLYAEGRFLSAARGEQKYQDNGEMTYGDAVEGLKSNALSRCCKDLGIALDLWDRQYADRWRQQHCVKVWRSGGGRKPNWRRADALPFFDETGIAADSPNQDRYVVPAGQGRAPQQEARPEPQRPTQQHQQTAPPRQREPGDDDEPVRRPDPAREAPRPRTGRTISEPQQKRLYAKATSEGGMTKDEYRDFLKGKGYDSDRDVLMADYDEIVAEAVQGVR